MSLLSDLPPDMVDYVLEKILEEKIIMRNNEPLKLFKVKYKSCDSVLDYTWENEKDLIQDPMFPALLRDFNLNLHRKRRVADRDESSEDDVALTKLSKRKRSTSDLDTSSPSNQSLDTSTVKAEKPELISQPMEPSQPRKKSEAQLQYETGCQSTCQQWPQ
ncbi:hypothetical protein BKA69DRAFT_697388 [Paraphysoderma sedebokerense]|nr:hypothetical protein BKA69DRAFT_697388 [Paraphysoderma sedebokerense]